MTSWKRRLRMGMVGGGQKAHIGAVHRLCAAMDGQVEIVAGCFSRDYDNTKITGEQLYLDPERCYRTFEEMADREARLPADQRIDFVVIVTPNNSHFVIAKKFLEKGFHVSCDKPMTYSLQEARDLAELVERTNLVFGLTHNYTGNALVREARELFRSGKMGTVRKAIVEYVGDFLAYPHEKEGQKQAVWRVDPRQSGLGGTLADVGSHAFNLLEHITGDMVKELCADKSSFLPDRTLDDDANILVRLAGGGKGVITVSQIASGEENALRLRVYGSKGAIVWDQENPNYMSVWFYGEPRQTYTRASHYLSAAAREMCRVPTGHPEGYLEAFANIYDGFVEAVRAFIDAKPLAIEKYKFPTVYDGLRGMDFITKAVESADKGSIWVQMES
ncbi:MAG: oxidoreductase [Desulfobacca sp. RBG_16_60_12]|nr:MAG: oxidoreductase [Desulfobacca sp. RBG_16_60_12]